MPEARVFFDSNVLLYLLSADTAKAETAEALLANGGIISVQVLNEITQVMRRKFAFAWPETREVLGLVRGVCTVVPLSVEIHEQGLALAERFQLSLYDAMIVAAAFVSGCETLYSEDMQDGQLIEQRLRICNPFSRAG